MGRAAPKDENHQGDLGSLVEESNELKCDYVTM